MSHSPIPAEHWFKRGARIAHCGVRMKWMAAPGYRLERGEITYRIDGKEYPVHTVRAVKNELTPPRVEY